MSRPLSNARKSRTIKTHCNSCSQETNHKIIHEYKNKDFTDVCGDGFSIDGHFIWQTAECMGCESVHLISKQYFSEWCEPNYDNDPNYDPYLNKYFPPRNIKNRSKPNWHSVFQSKKNFASTVYEQIYQLMEEYSDATIAIMLLIRSLLEAIVVDKAGDARTFKEKLERLRNQNLITENDVSNLDREIYDAGSATMHRNYNPSIEAINIALNAVENLIFKLYISDADTCILKNEKPQKQIIKIDKACQT